ncbi:MAG: radical SAM protein [bacterium]
MLRPRNKHALLVNPWITDFAAYDFWIRPLGLLTVAAALRNAGFDVTLIDCLDRSHPSVQGKTLRNRNDGTGNFLKTKVPKPEVLRFVPRIYGRYGIPLEVFEEELACAPAPDIVIVTSSMTYWYPAVFEAIARIGAHFTDVPVVLGGRYATICADHARQHSGADCVLEGHLGHKTAQAISELTEVDIEISDVYSDLPPPAHDLQRDTSVAAVSLTRGCPCRCTYCVSHLLSPKFELRTADSAISEIRFLTEELGTRHIAFYDDALLAQADELLIPLLRFVIRKNYRINFYTPNALHASLMTPEIARLMAHSGFAQIRLGFESTDPNFLRSTGGKVNPEQFRRAVACLKEAGFKSADIGAYIICGHPMQNEEDIHLAMNAVAELGVIPILAEYSPIPGSEDFEAAVASFRHPPDQDPLLHNSSIVMYQHPSISPQEFQRLKLESLALRKKLSID